MKEGTPIGLKDRYGLDILIGDVVEYHPSHYKNQTKREKVYFSKGYCHPRSMLTDNDRVVVEPFTIFFSLVFPIKN